MKNLEKYDEKKVYPKCIQAYKSGGFQMNYDKDEKVKEIILQTSKEVAKTLLAGQFVTLSTLVKPIAMCSTITVIESQAMQFQTFPFYLNQAAEINDPLVKMKLTMAAFMSSVYRSFEFLGSKIPLDPANGETLQVIQPDGSRFYGETIQRVPTVIAFLLIGPNENYKVFGSGKLEGEFKGLNMLRGYKRGKTLVKFKDGTEIQVTNPIVQAFQINTLHLKREIDGIISGDRVAKYIQNIIYADKKNQLLGELTFSNSSKLKSSGIGGKIAGMFSKQAEEYITTTDDFSIEISKYEKNAQGQIQNKKVLSQGNGSWLSFLQFDGNIYWKITDKVPEWKQTQNEIILPSNSTLRQDKQLLIAGQTEQAQEQLAKLNKSDCKDDELRKAKQKH